MTHATMTKINEVVRQAISVYCESGLTTNDLLKQRYALKAFAEEVQAGDQEPGKLVDKAAQIIAFIDSF